MQLKADARTHCESAGIIIPVRAREGRCGRSKGTNQAQAVRRALGVAIREHMVRWTSSDGNHSCREELSRQRPVAPGSISRCGWRSVPEASERVSGPGHSDALLRDEAFKVCC